MQKSHRLKKKVKFINSKLIFLACKTVANGLANTGIKLSITAVLNKCHDIIDKFYESNMQEKDVKQKINDDDLVHSGRFFTSYLPVLVALMEYINESLKFLLHIFIDNFQTELMGQIEFEKMKLMIFFTCNIILFVFLWMPYLNMLTHQIWRTKGMLNMIPLNIIRKNDELKAKFCK